MKQKQINTIKDAVEQLQTSIQAAMPDMGVAVNISLTALPATNTNTNTPEPIPEKLAQEIDLIALRGFLNSLVKEAGKKETLALVKTFTNGDSINPDDIPVEKYQELVNTVTKNYPNLELTFNDKDTP